MTRTQPGLRAFADGAEIKLRITGADGSVRVLSLLPSDARLLISQIEASIDAARAEYLRRVCL